MTKKIAGTTPGICNLMLRGDASYRSEKATSIIFVNVF